MSIFSKLFGDPNQKILQQLQTVVLQINSFEQSISQLTDQELKDKFQQQKKELANGKTLDDLLPLVFALTRETAKRVLHQRPFDAQLMGGIVLHRGQIAEMKTGEGKTLASTLPICLNALAGQGAHVITVNDYLARRDAVWMGQIYHFLGLSIGCLNNQSAYLYDPDYIVQTEEEKLNEDKARDLIGGYRVMSSYLRPVERQLVYQADITYGTNNEFGFDYLRDNMVMGEQQLVQRQLHYAIIDEIDSILIDEARTPLIISAPAEQSTNLYYRLADLVNQLKKEEDYNIDEKMRAVSLTDAGQNKLSRWLNKDPWKTNDIELVYHIEAALKAKEIFSLDKEYVIRQGEIVIVDEFTGRLMFGRRYSEGLHQAIEAKEKLEVKRESQTLATITFQNLFRLYNKLSGMTGTAISSAEEFYKVYQLETISIPTNNPMIRQNLVDKIYSTEKGKIKAIVEDIRKQHQAGCPILIGTRSIAQNELMSQHLRQAGIEHQILNAKNHQREAEIIAQAGQLGAVTLATNMAGRGVDIVLGGNPIDADKANKIKELGGLYVIGTERHESRRIDNQLRGRAGRQGDAGSSQVYVSLEDELMRIFGGEKLKSMMATLHFPEDMPIENKLISHLIESAQNKVEGANFDLRKHLLEYDDVLNKQRQAIYQQRKKILFTRQTTDIILQKVQTEISKVVNFHTNHRDLGEWNLTEIMEVVGTIISLPEENKQQLLSLWKKDTVQLAEKQRNEIINYLSKLAEHFHQQFEENINQLAKTEAFALSLNKKDITPSCLLEKIVILKAIDTLWIEHLSAMSELKRGIGLRGYGQQDPLVAYKKESSIKYHQLLIQIDRQIVYSIYKTGFSVPAESAKKHIQFSGPSKTMQQGKTFSGNSQSQLNNKLKTVKEVYGRKVGRNELCPCGSEKKFKHCCGKN